MWPIHFATQQKLTQHPKATILQKKVNKNKAKVNTKKKIFFFNKCTSLAYSSLAPEFSLKIPSLHTYNSQIQIGRAELNLFVDSTDTENFTPTPNIFFWVKRILLSVSGTTRY